MSHAWAPWQRKDVAAGANEREAACDERQSQALDPQSKKDGKGAAEPLAAFRVGGASRIRALLPKEERQAMKHCDHLSEERARARSLARDRVLRARSRVLFELLSAINGTIKPSDVRIGLQAAALVRESICLPEDQETSREAGAGYEETGLGARDFAKATGGIVESTNR